MSEREQLFEAFDEIEIDEDEKKTAWFEGDEVLVLDTYLRNKSKIALIQTPLMERFEVYYEMLDK